MGGVLRPAAAKVRAAPAAALVAGRPGVSATPPARVPEGARRALSGVALVA